MRAVLLCTALFVLAAPVSEAQQTPETLPEPLAAPHEMGMTTSVEPAPTVEVISDSNLRVESTQVTPEPATEIGAQVSARNMFAIIGVVVVIVALITLFT